MKELLHDDDMREEGRAEERENTEREKARADAREARAEALEVYTSAAFLASFSALLRTLNSEKKVFSILLHSSCKTPEVIFT